MTYEYVKTQLMAEKDVPYRVCTICKTPMTFTMRQYAPNIISCKCREDGSQPLLRLTWDELRILLEDPK